jgi:hypothetical protein
MNPELFDNVFTGCIVFAILSLLVSLMCAVNYVGRFKYYLYSTFDGNAQYVAYWETIYSLVATSVVFHLCWLSVGLFFVSTARSGGCGTLADDASWLVTTEIVLFVLTFLMCCYGVPLEITVLSWMFMWFGLFFVSVFAVLCYLRDDAAIRDFLNVWALENRPVPVWVGEFGTVLPGNDRVFDIILNYIVTRYDLDFAYWPFNGDNYRFGRFASEGFGVMEPDYVTVKNYTNVVRVLFG